MRTYLEIEADARDEPAFSNGTEYEAWFENWCARCQHPAEKAWRAYEAGKRKTQLKGFEGGCPLTMCAIATEKTPIEWMPQPGFPFGDQYHCIEFRGPDNDGGREPRPKPPPPGMDGLFPQPERRRRMLTPLPDRQLVNV